jgi:hypothetical protein
MFRPPEYWQEWEAGAAAVHDETWEEASSLRRLFKAVALEQFLDWIITSGAAAASSSRG